MQQLSWPINMMTSNVEAEVESFLSVALRNGQDPWKGSSMNAFPSNMRPVQLPRGVNRPESRFADMISFGIESMLQVKSLKNFLSSRLYSCT